MPAPAEMHDLIVIGAGPGGYVAAIRAAQLGMKVACVERERPGGICLNWGCIPTKALLKSAEVMRTVRHAAEWGIEVSGTVGFDWKKVIGRSRTVAEKLSRGVEGLFKKYGVVHVSGTATLTGRGRVEVAPAGDKAARRRLEAPRILLATGARAKHLPGIEPDGKRIVTYRDAMVLPDPPKSVVVIGAGAIGIEFADFWNAFGAEVTIVEALPRILPIEDEDISQTLARILRKKGMTIHTGAKVSAVEASAREVVTTVTTQDGKTLPLRSERLLLAAGVRANVEGFGLEGMGVLLERGFINVDDAYQTSSPGIYAVGDCTGPPLLAHVAMAEAVVCVEAIAGRARRAVPYDAIPGCTYCDPEVASIGKTEAEARGAGLDVSVGRFPFTASGKALAAGHSDGFVKIVTDKARGEIVGVHAIGAGVTDLIAEMSLAMTSEATAYDIVAAVHPHPTLSEAMLEAAAAALGEAVHT